VDVVRPSWRWVPGMNTQAASLRAGLDRVPNDATLLVMEDDDVYLPGHVANMVNALQLAEATGERVARYYHVGAGRYRVLPSRHHASLAATGVRRTGLNAFRNVCTGTKNRIDITFWQTFAGIKQFLDTGNVVGIKGLPGRPGIGVGHRRNFGKPDDGTKLREWIGDLADNYETFREAV